LPCLAIFLLIMPIIFFLKLYLNRNTFHKINLRLKWGYLFNEYKLSAYFWEFIKMITRLSVIIALSFYVDNIVIKGILIYLIL